MGEDKKKTFTEKAMTVQSEIDEIEEAGIMISRDVFNTWLRTEEMVELLEEVDIETSTKYELFDVLDVDMGGELGIDELVGGLMRLRGPISKSDIVAVRLKVRHMTKLIEDIWNQTCNTE